MDVDKSPIHAGRIVAARPVQSVLATARRGAVSLTGRFRTVQGRRVTFAVGPTRAKRGGGRYVPAACQSRNVLPSRPTTGRTGGQPHGGLPPARPDSARCPGHRRRGRLWLSHRTTRLSSRNRALDPTNCALVSVHALLHDIRWSRRGARPAVGLHHDGRDTAALDPGEFQWDRLALSSSTSAR